jgi:nucleotide-binding universal stress UspA family protein
MTREPIAVGTDGSAHADLAVEWAADEAALRHRPLHIVHAVERWEYDAPLETMPGMPESFAEAGEHILADGADRATKARPGLAVTTELMFESPAYSLRSLGDRAAEIVVGHRGLGGFAGMLLGSTGLRLAGHVPVPVVVVRGETHERRGEVLVGVDLSEESAVVLEYAFDAAAIRGAWVRAVHVWQVPYPLYSGAYPVSIHQAAAVSQERLADTVARWRARYPDVRVIEQAPPGQTVRELAERSARAALLVVGSRGSAGLHGLHLGSVSHGAIHHADCPVAVVRTHA